MTPWSTAQEPPQIQEVAFRPANPVDDAYVAEVDVRCIPRTEPSPFERDGQPAWTNLYFTDLIGATAGAFVCDYHLPASRDLAKRRRVLDGMPWGSPRCPRCGRTRHQHARHAGSPRPMADVVRSA